MENEQWKSIVGYPNYLVSSFGKIANIKYMRLLKPSKGAYGYANVRLCNAEGKRLYRIHRLVAFSFLENPEHKPCVDHINNDKFDNRLCNLRFATVPENGRNVGKRKDNILAKGVSFNKARQKFEARIMINGKSKHLGYFATLDEAKEVRIKKANEVFDTFVNACEKV